MNSHEESLAHTSTLLCTLGTESIECRWGSISTTSTGRTTSAARQQGLLVLLALLALVVLLVLLVLCFSHLAQALPCRSPPPLGSRLDAMGYWPGRC